MVHFSFVSTLVSLSAGRKQVARAKTFRHWISATVVLLLALAVAPPSTAQQTSPQQGGNVLLEGNEQLFSVLAALNASGYDTGLGANTGSNTREVVRTFLAAKKIASVADIRKFYEAHKIGKDSGADLGQYISLALLLGPSPDFKLTVREADLPPDAKRVVGLVPLLKIFAEQANLPDLWSRLQSRYQAEVARYSEPVRTSVQLADAYLRFPSGAYLGRTYTIYLSLLGSPDQVQARIYGANYFLVVTPSRQSKVSEIRHQYLHFLLDPLAVKYALEIHQKAELSVAAHDAPLLAEDFKQDFPLLLTECLIRAVELRMDRKPKADAARAVQELAASGLILTPYFYAALGDYERQDSSISAFYKTMLTGIDVRAESQRIATVKFTPRPAASESKQVPAQTEEERLVSQGENSISQGHYDAAKTAFQTVLEKLNPRNARALYGLAAAYTYTRKPDLAEEYFVKALGVAEDVRIATWSHIYLGRIYDLKGKRDEALAQYRAASLTAAAYPDAQRAVQTGLQQPYGSKSNHP